MATRRRFASPRIDPSPPHTGSLMYGALPQGYGDYGDYGDAAKRCAKSLKKIQKYEAQIVEGGRSGQLRRWERRLSRARSKYTKDGCAVLTGDGYGPLSTPNDVFIAQSQADAIAQAEADAAAMDAGFQPETVVPMSTWLIGGALVFGGLAVVAAVIKK
jgi:hypothetical protein